MLTRKEIKYILENYNVKLEQVKTLKDGTADIFIINNSMVLKYYQFNFDLQKILLGIKMCNFLKEKGFNVPKYFLTSKNKAYTIYKERYCILMSLISGNVIRPHTANELQLINSSKFYAHLEDAMQNVPFDLPNYNIEKYTLKDIEKSVQELQELILKTPDLDIKTDLSVRLNLIKDIKQNMLQDNLDKLSLINCHGDFYVSQCLFYENEINGIVDFESSKKMPVTLEIFRSYIYLDTVFNIDNLIKYITAFNKIYKLNIYDIYYMPYLYYIRLLRSTFGYKEYIENRNKKTEYLNIGKKLQNQIIFLSNNVDTISLKLVEFFKDKI